MQKLNCNHYKVFHGKEFISVIVSEIILDHGALKCYLNTIDRETGKQIILSPESFLYDLRMIGKDYYTEPTIEYIPSVPETVQEMLESEDAETVILALGIIENL